MLLTLSGCVNIDNNSKGAEFRFVKPITPETEEAVINSYHPLGFEELPVPFNVSALPEANIPVLI